MTNNSSKQSAKTQAAPRGVYNPITVGNREDENEELPPPAMRLLAGLLFTAIFVVGWRQPALAPLTILVLAACLLFRLDERQRKLAAAPLILAAIRLCMLLSAQIPGTSNFGWFVRPAAPFAPAGSLTELGITWIPTFLSVCLFYLPRKDSITLKIVAFEAIAVILSSLLPGEGYSTVLTVFKATLFFAVTIGLLLDLKPGVKELFRSSQYQQTPIRVHIPAPPPPRPVG